MKLYANIIQFKLNYFNNIKMNIIKVFSSTSKLDVLRKMLVNLTKQQ